MKIRLMLLTTIGALALGAAPVSKSGPVAAGYPDWQGVVSKNYISGREICASDLRHKITVVVEFEPNAALQSLFVLGYKLVSQAGLYGVSSEWDWENKPILPRDVIVVFSNRGGGKDSREPILNALKYKGEDENIARALSSVRGPECSIYDNVTFSGAPDSSGKRPFVYIMGTEGTAPVYQGALNAKTVGAAIKAIGAERAKMKKAGFTWVPFYGSVPEPKFNPQIAPAIAKGKPLAAVEKALLKDVVGKDADKAKEAQILYDALNQTRSDMVFRACQEARKCPYRAAFDMQQLVKYWPGEKKRLDVVTGQLKAVPEANKLAQIYCKMMAWEDPNFVCKNGSEAKKIVGELNKMKKDLEKFKESKVKVVQDGAALMDFRIDTLIETIPTRLPEK